MVYVPQHRGGSSWHTWIINFIANYQSPDKNIKMFYFCCNLILVSAIVAGCKFATGTITAINSDNTTNPEGPHETQRAVCTVTAGEVRASAEAVTTKTLQGVCRSDEMNLALRKLELKLYKELQDIKLLLKELQNPNFRDELENTYNKNLVRNVTSSTPAHAKIAAITETTSVVHKNSILQLKALLTKSNQPLNEKSFSYYWKLENFMQHVNSSSTKIESPIFSIKGKPLRIKASFNHLHRDYLNFHLVYATFEKRDKLNNNIVLDTGGIFKHIDDKVLFKYKISILDQNNSLKDLVSQEFSTLDSGFPVPMSALLLPTYSKNNSLLIQIALYL